MPGRQSYYGGAYEGYPDPMGQDLNTPFDLATQDYLDLLRESDRLAPKPYWQQAPGRTHSGYPHVSYAGSENIQGTPRGYDYISALNKLAERRDWARENEYQQALIAKLDEEEKASQARYAQTGSRQNVSSFAPNYYQRNGSYYDPWLYQRLDMEGAKSGKSPLQWAERTLNMENYAPGMSATAAGSSPGVAEIIASQNLRPKPLQEQYNAKGEVGDIGEFQNPSYFQPGLGAHKALIDWISQKNLDQGGKAGGLQDLRSQLGRIFGVDMSKSAGGPEMPDKGKKMPLAANDKMELISDLMKPGPDGKPVMDKGAAIFYANLYERDPHTMPEPIKMLLGKWYRNLPGAPEPDLPIGYGPVKVHPNLVGRIDPNTGKPYAPAQEDVQTSVVPTPQTKERNLRNMLVRFGLSLNPAYLPYQLLQKISPPGMMNPLEAMVTPYLGASTGGMSVPDWLSGTTKEIWPSAKKNINRYLDYLNAEG